jgi:pyrroline-5-carboxylate reductase
VSDLPKSLVLVGAGKMGGALLQGWLALGLAPSALTVIDPAASAELQAAAAEKGFRLNPEASTVRPAEVLVLAIKPQTLESAAEAINPLVGSNTTVISIMAGKTVRDITERLGHARAVVRAMPNTPASVGRGITGAFANALVDARQRAVADALLGCVGGVEWVASEGLIDAVTALSGSGPAYVFLLVECMAQAGVAAGLPVETAQRLARATVEGAGELLFREPATGADQLRRNVTSPGGTTAAALDVLMGPDGLAPLMEKAIGAAKRRAEELSG